LDELKPAFDFRLIPAIKGRYYGIDIHGDGANNIRNIDVSALPSEETGMYYLRTKAATDAIKFTVDKTVTEEPKAAKIVEDQQAAIACSLDDPEGCEMCSG
jgi:hypothetical protein